MGYVDLRKRQTERAQDRRKLVGFWCDVEHDPYLSMVAGMVLGFLVSLVSLFMVGPFLMRSPSSLLIIVIVALIMLLAFLALRGIWQLRLRNPGSVRDQVWRGEAVAHGDPGLRWQHHPDRSRFEDLADGGRSR